MTEAYFCVDLGGTKTAWAVYDKSGTELAYGKFPTEPAKGAADLVRRVHENASPVLEKYRILGACLASPGPLDLKNGKIVRIVTMGWENIEIVRLFSNQFKLPFLLLNDCDAGALGVAHLPEFRSYRTVCYMSLSTGIGGGIVIDGNLFNGQGNGGNFGHMPVPGEGLPCGCGKVDCLELYASGSGLERRYRLFTGTKLSCAEIEALAKQGDQVAHRLYRDAAAALLFAADSLKAVIDPDILVLGGSVCRSGDILLDLITMHHKTGFAPEDGKQVLAGAFVYAQQNY